MTSCSGPIPACSDVEQDPGGLLDAFLDPHQEGHRFTTVDDAVVVGDGDVIIGRISTLSPTAIGRRSILCMPRMPDCGGLRIGVDISEP